MTPFGYEAALAAYSHPECARWRLRLLAYVRANRDHALLSLAVLPGVRATYTEASYLLWLDVSGALPDGLLRATAAAAGAGAELPPGATAGRTGTTYATAAELLLAHGVALSDGATFGATSGHVRLNLGCTRETLDRGLQRIHAALALAAADPAQV